MKTCGDLLETARTFPASLRIRDAERLARCFGFEMVRQRGSHRLFKAASIREIVNLQDRGGMAKPYQVRQIVKLIDLYGLTWNEENDEARR
jgi:predicted RNA binding protein YcfA (HicA-like mRNA interferase family)